MSSYYRFHDVDSYDTPDNVKKSWLFPLLGHCRAYFYFDNFHTFAVSGMVFQDAWNLDLKRLKRCYICEMDSEHGMVPFCAYNLTDQEGKALYRR